MRLRKQTTWLALLALAAVLTVAYAPVHAAVRPPKLQYQMTTLGNGLYAAAVTTGSNFTVSCSGYSSTVNR